MPTGDDATLGSLSLGTWKPVDHPGRHWACANCCEPLSPACGWLNFLLRSMGVSSLPFALQSAVAPGAAAQLQRASTLAQKLLGRRSPGPRRLSRWRAGAVRSLARSLEGPRRRAACCCRAPALARPGPAARSQLTDEGQRPAAPRAVIRAAGSWPGVLAALVRSLPHSLLAGEPAPRPRATPLSRDAESSGNTEGTEANFHFPLAELRWPALGTAF